VRKREWASEQRIKTSDEELVCDAARVREEQGSRSGDADGDGMVPGGRQAAGGLTQRCHGHGRALLVLGETCGSWRRGRGNDRERLAASSSLRPVEL
jgi:hypothetical protein